MTLQGIVRLGGDQKIARNQSRALMNQLVERVLSVRARLAPHDGTGRHIDDVAVAIDALAVAFHIELLKKRWETAQILVVRQDGVAVRAQKIGVPDTKETKRDRQIRFERRRPEVLVHQVRAVEKR